jgi:NAD-dependent deacetylase
MAVSSKGMAQARKLIAEAKHLCVLTGAGISAESGIQTFRDAGGLWENQPVEKVATPQGFEEDPELVWQFYNARRKSADVASPNPAHLALARLEVAKRRQANSPKGRSAFVLMTQNIDGLHQQAGSVHVVELHGSIWKVRCSACGQVTTDHPIELKILPKCDSCKGLLRPHVVWFGETLEIDVLAQAEAATLGCDLFLVVGTSAIVQPAASYPVVAAKREVPVIEVNLEPTPISPIATVTLMGKAGEILPKIVGN